MYIKGRAFSALNLKWTATLWSSWSLQFMESIIPFSWTFWLIYNEPVYLIILYYKLIMRTITRSHAFACFLNTYDVVGTCRCSEINEQTCVWWTNWNFLFCFILFEDRNWVTKTLCKIFTLLEEIYVQKSKTTKQD